jgi:hypothetical protein
MSSSTAGSAAAKRLPRGFSRDRQPDDRSGDTQRSTDAPIGCRLRRPRAPISVLRGSLKAHFPAGSLVTCPTVPDDLLDECAGQAADHKENESGDYGGSRLHSRVSGGPGSTY